MLSLKDTHIGEDFQNNWEFPTVSNTRAGQLWLNRVNLNTANQATLHTTPNCTQCEPRFQTGNSLTYNCDASINNNVGCGVQITQPNSYGRDFNANGGGYHIMHLSRDIGIRIWFKQREDIEINVWKRDGNDLCVDLTTWGLPDAAFTWDECDYDSHFNAQNFLFDLTFCGDWAGNVYSTSGSRQLH